MVMHFVDACGISVQKDKIEIIYVPGLIFSYKILIRRDGHLD